MSYVSDRFRVKRRAPINRKPSTPMVIYVRPKPGKSVQETNEMIKAALTVYRQRNS